MISFIDQDEFNKIAELEVIPKPNQFIRVIILIKPCDEYITPTIKVEDVQPVLRSSDVNSPLVIEWGGMRVV